MDDLYLDGGPFFFYFLVLLFRARDAALGISDEVDRLGLKGSKKLDEDWMVTIVPYFLLFEY
jgi:hypothetical protein